MARRYFGTDGVRGIVGEDLTPQLVERLGRAATLWAGGGAVLIGRDTRGSGRELEQAFASGVASAGGHAVLAGILPTPAVALPRLSNPILSPQSCGAAPMEASSSSSASSSRSFVSRLSSSATRVSSAAPAR